MSPACDTSTSNDYLLSGISYTFTRVSGVRWCGVRAAVDGRLQIRPSAPRRCAET